MHLEEENVIRIKTPVLCCKTEEQLRSVLYQEIEHKQNIFKICYLVLPMLWTAMLLDFEGNVNALTQIIL